MTKSEAKLVLGSGLSMTSKMPSFSFNLSALACKTGAKLVEVIGSVCEGCYALGGNYQRYKLPQKMLHKTERIQHPLWVKALVKLIKNQGNTKDKEYFRWHDSGDLQSIEHLRKIVEVCEMTPEVMHWLPTREYKIVKSYLINFGEFPKKLVVRLSAHMIDQKPPSINNLNTSTVHKSKGAIGTECGAYKNNNECGDCRLCWDPKEKNISYKYH